MLGVARAVAVGWFVVVISSCGLEAGQTVSVPTGVARRTGGQVWLATELRLGRNVALKLGVRRGTDDAARLASRIPIGLLPKQWVTRNAVAVIPATTLLTTGFTLTPWAAQDTSGWAEFGVSVAALSDTIFVAATPTIGSRRGSSVVYVYKWNRSQWVNTAELPVPEATVEDVFGISMAAHRDTLVVGAQFSDARGEDAGLAYVFERHADGWRQAAVLSASDSAAGDQFGLTVSLSGETMIVGARLADTHGVDAGAAYVFTRREGRWEQAAKLIAHEPARGDLFGRSSVDGDTMIVSADLNDDRGGNAGKAYVFARSGDRWAEVAQLTAKDGSAGDEFGISLALESDTAVFGAPGCDTRAENSGAAYVFERRHEQWSQTARLAASDGASRQGFGAAVVTGGDTIVVGAPNDGGRGEGAGAAYVFERRGGEWTESAKLTASDATAASGFGSTVAISGSTLIVGMQLNAHGKRSGAAYVFERRQGAWAEVARVSPTGSAP